MPENISASGSSFGFSSTLLRPAGALLRSSRASFGRRRSQSMSSTRFSASANEIARFSAVMLLPSP